MSSGVMLERSVSESLLACALTSALRSVPRSSAEVGAADATASTHANSARIGDLDASARGEVIGRMFDVARVRFYDVPDNDGGPVVGPRTKKKTHNRRILIG